MDREKFLIVLALIIIATLTFLGVKDFSDTGKEYKKVCVEMGGKPIYNGRHWECLTKFGEKKDAGILHP